MNPSARPLLIVDGMILAYRVNHSLGWMKTSKGVPTGLRFGVLRSLISWQKKFDSSDIIIAWDLPGPIKKAEGTPEYKANRVHSEAEQDMFSQLAGLRTFLSKTRWAQVWLPGYEADDLIGALVQSEALKPVVIISSDGDLHQLLRNGVTQWGGGSRDHFITQETVIAKWSVTPRQLPLLRAVLGDPSDNLKPLLEGDLKHSFWMYLQSNSKVETYKQVADSGAWPPRAIQEDAFWLELARRESLMRLHIPDVLPIHAGTKDSEFLLHEFEAMESKALPGQLHLMV